MAKKKQFQPCRGEYNCGGIIRGRGRLAVFCFSQLLTIYVFALYWQICLKYCSIKNYLSSASAIIVVWREESVSLNASRSNQRGKKNKKLQRTQWGQPFSYVARTCSLQGRPSVSCSSWRDFATLNQKAFKNILEVRPPHDAAEDRFH